jgi:hypothetical protein
MSECERRDFLACYEGQKTEVFNNRHVLEFYCQDDVTVLRQACQVFRREFLQIGNIEVFQESITIASACNKVLRKRFLKPYTICSIPAGGYTGDVKYSKKAIMWLLYKEKVDGIKILHARNGREYRLPELPHLSVDGFCPEKRKVLEFCGCFWHGHTCLPFRDVPTMCGITLNYNASRLVNFDVIKDMILNGGPGDTVTVHTDKKIKRKKRGAGVAIVTEPELKIYRVCFQKRRRLNDNTSVPLGYK